MKNSKPDNKIIKKEPDSFYFNIFQNSMNGKIIVNEDLLIISANKKMYEYVQARPPKEEGITFGRAFHCAQVGEDVLKCGSSEKCKKCGIWKAVKKILQDKNIVQNQVIQYTFKKGHTHEEKWFQINGRHVYKEGHYAVLEFTEVTELFAEVVELKRQIKELRKNLSMDLATGTLNKQSLVEAIERLQDSGTVRYGFTICMIDFDDFKSINDQFGHLMGDRVLKVFSDIARKHISTKDILGRYGGEEFIFVFNDMDQNQSLIILKRIHLELEEYFAAEKLAVPVTFSAGAVYVDISSGIFPQYSELLDGVDKMLYHAKRLGKSRAMGNMGEVIFNRS